MIKGFRLQIILRFILLITVVMFLAWSIFERPTLFVIVFLTLLLVLSILDLIRYVERSTRDLTHFLMAVKQRGFTESFPGAGGSVSAKFTEAMGDILSEFARVNEEKELHFQFLEALNENINVAILAFRADGSLMMMNLAAKKLLQEPKFTRIEQLDAIDPILGKTISTLQGDHQRVIPVRIREQIVQLGIHRKHMLMKGQPIMIVVMQNLNHELEAKEIEAWHQLMRVLTHEIMNSVTPITSLSAAVDKILRHPDGAQKNPDQLTADALEDVGSAVQTIRSRSQGLLNFTRTYKEFSKPFILHRESHDVNEVVRHVYEVMKLEAEKRSIQFVVNLISEKAEAEIDRALIEQVLINLVQNAFDAVKEDGQGMVTLEVGVFGNRLSVLVRDNGPGIDPEIVDKIFVPFFTTKPNGSGIGLSLARQIIKLHGGNIRVVPTELGAVLRIDL